MVDIAHLDFEVFSELDIRKVGGYRFCRHPSSEVLIACYELPGMKQPVTWLPFEEEPPEDLVEYIEDGGKIGAHNAGFERMVCRYVLPRQHRGFPVVKDSQWVCTAAKAAASGLPRALDKALKAAGLPVRKNPDGDAFIKRFCKLRKPTKADPRTRIKPRDDWDAFKRGIVYCRDDVIGEKALDAALPNLTYREQRIFVLDLVMNDRGVPLDLPLIQKALTVVQSLERSIAAKVATLTGGLKATQTAKMLAFFNERGIELENMQAKTIKEIIKRDDLDDKTKQLLQLRVEASKASTKKLATMLLVSDPKDHVAQGCFLIYGAHTGRYAGRLIQPQNFIRGMLKAHQRELVFELLEHADPELFELLYDWPIDTISQCMRGFIKAPKGYEFAVVDYTAIEARVLAWIAGEEHMLKAYRQGLDVYKLMAMKLFGVKNIDDVDDEQRRIAKNLVLGCGYQLGGPNFVKYAEGQGVFITEEFAIKAVRVYRNGHPAIVESWKTVEQLVVGAITHPGRVYKGLKCEYYMHEHWLCIKLPSGREVRYPYATATPTMRWGKPAHQISFRTEIKGQWVRETTYGGKLIENIVQAIARDIMLEGMLNAEAGGWPVIGTVHDEALTLVKRGQSRIKELEKIVCDIPQWGRGIPLAAKGFTCVRYEKG